MLHKLTAFTLLFMFMGCSSGPTVPTSIQGRITLQKRPINGGTIVFTPDNLRGTVGQTAGGEIFSDGSYTVNPLPGKDSITPGWYKVSFLSNGLSPKFSAPESSGQVKQIIANQVNKIDFNLE